MTTPSGHLDDQTHIPRQQGVTPPPKRRTPWLPIAGAVAVVLVAATVGGWLVFRPSTAARAVTACQEMVSERLRAPSTAEFVDPRVEARGSADDLFVVSGQVDSQNGFGSMVRSTYSCELHTPDGGKSWNNNGVKVS